MKLYSRDRARRSLFDTIGYRALSQVATVLSYVVLVRSMSEQAFGVFSLLYSVVPIVTTFGSLGLDQTLRRYQPEYLRTGQPSVAAWLVRAVRVGRLGSSILIVATILLGWNWIALWFDLVPYRPDFAIFGLLILIYFQVSILQYSLASRMLHQYSVGSVAVLSSVKLASYLVLASFFELTLRNAIFADTVAYGAACLFLAFAHRHAVDAQSAAKPQRPSPDDLRRLKRYAGFSLLNESASLLTYTETDRFFIAAMMNPQAVGAYAFYTRLSEMAATFVPLRLFDNLVQPLFFGVPATEAREKIPRYFTLLVNMNLAYQLPLIAFTAVYHRELVGVVFGGKFVDQSALLPVVIAFATSDNIISLPITMVAQYREKTSLILMSQAFGLYQIVAMLVLVPAIGLMGAVIATGTFHLLRNLFVWWNVRHDAVWTNFRSVAFLSVAIWGVAAWVCSAWRNVASFTPVESMISGAIVCAVAGVLYIRSAAISDSDRHILSQVLHGQEARVLRWVGVLPRNGQQ